MEKSESAASSSAPSTFRYGDIDSAGCVSISVCCQTPSLQSFGPAFVRKFLHKVCEDVRHTETGSRSKRYHDQELQKHE
jgi:hypothetical protein